jgi:signal transduction histidine kinase
MHAQIRKLSKDRKNIPLHELRYVCVDGRTVDVEAAASPFRHMGRAAVQLVMRDVTKRKEVDRLKSEFISTVSHELRTPLTSIGGALGLIAGGAVGQTTPKMMSLINLAKSNSDRLGRLINDLLDIEKIEAGKIEIIMKPLDLMGLIEHSIEANRTYADGFGVQLKIAGRVPGGSVLADVDRLEQVMANLLSNAAKFSPRGETVDVSVEQIDECFRISITDRGPGIPKAFHSRIFQKFAQADASDTRQKGGTGLGLSITKALVERMGGRIEFRPGVDRGTTFVVQLRSLNLSSPAPADCTVTPRRPASTFATSGAPPVP